MKKISVKILTVFLCFVLVFPTVCFPAYAVDPVVDFYDTDSVGSWDNLFATASPRAVFINYLASLWGCDTSAVYWEFMNRTLQACYPSGAGRGETQLDQLYKMAENLNAIFNSPPKSGPLAGWFTGFSDSSKYAVWESLLGVKKPNFQVKVSLPSGQFRIRDIANDIWVVKSDGRYPYAVNAGSDLPESQQNQWVDVRSFTSAPTDVSVNMLSYDILSAMCAQLNELGTACKITSFGNYKAIVKYAGSSGYYYADPEGRPFVCWANEDQSATSQDRPDTTIKDINGDVIQIEGDLSDNSTNIDLSGMTITLPDGKVLIADNIIYDESTKTYNIDSHDVINNYITYNYSWTYHINYTSITYIGQTEEYNKYYEVYYELPDGRDSADLTAEEVEQLNVSIDVIPYGRSADDTSLRSLYHFDGDTKDSSYWNYCTDFTWNTGASLTYMDSGTFEGCLYLDETEHDFTLMLPSSIGSGDFTLQFRYYQSYTAAPQTDSYIQFGNSVAIQLDGKNIKNSSGTALGTYSSGTWNELALMRSGSTLYVYVNGLCIGSVSYSAVLNNLVQFHFGSSQQTYKQIDELRILNYALETGGASYTCTSVPYDTNLTLVLPDSQTPVADEYYNITFNDRGSHRDYTNNAAVYNLKGATALTGSLGAIISANINNSDSRSNYTYFRTASDLTNIATQGLRIATNLNDCSYYYVVFSVIVDGDIYSVSGVVMGNDDDYDSWYDSYKVVDVPGGYIRFSKDYAYLLVNPSGSGVNIQGYELWKSAEYTSVSAARAAAAEYDASNKLSCELITSIVGMDPAQMRTPTLAVRTDLDITSYQIGGVRPSLPKKGQVWALVEGDRITSIQIYNGSAWEGCDGRIWTGERWVPASSYNIITLQDMYDIVDATPNYEYIYTESGFWAWWQKAWIAFTDKLFSSLGTGSGGSGGSTAPTSVKQALAAALSALIESLFAVITTVLQSLLGLVTDMLSFFFNFLTDTVLGGISNFFSAFTDGSLTEWFQQTGEDGSTTIGLPSQIITAFSFISGVIMLLPAELRGILFFGIGLMLLMSVFKLVKE